MQGISMTEGTPWKHIVRFALPVLAGNTLQQLYNTVDTLIIGRYAGEACMSAVGTCMSIIFMFNAIAIGFSSGNGVVVAQHYGAQNIKQMREAASTGIIMLLALGAASAVIGMTITRPLYTYVVDVPRGIIEYTIIYFRIFSIGMFFQFGYNIIAAILRAVGDSAATLYFLLIASVMNIFLDILFVAVFKMGVAGAAAATDISQAVSFAAAYIYMIRKYQFFRFRPREFVWNSDQAALTVKIGYPIALQMFIVSFGMTLIQRAVNGFGETMTASFTVGRKIELYINLPCIAFQTTMATYTGQNIGAGKIDRVRKGVKQTMCISLAMTVVISALIWICAENICNLFALGPEAAEYCIRHLRCVSICNVILSAYIPLFGVFQGANHPAVAAFVAVSTLSLRVIITYLLRYSRFFGYTIIWWNCLFGFALGIIIVWGYYFSGKWMKGSSVTERSGQDA